jgi:hypothetical protein
MATTRFRAMLLRWLEHGEYVVDPGAVAEAMLASGVFVALEAANPGPCRVDHDEPLSGPDFA